MLSDAVFRFDRAQVKHGDVVQVSLIIVAINSSAHLGRYTLTASNAAGSASASIAVRLVAAASSPSTTSYAYQTPGDRHPAAVLQHPATQQSGIFAKLLVPRTHNKLGDRSFSAAGPRLWTPAAGTYFRLFQTIFENSFIRRPKRLVTLLNL